MSLSKRLAAVAALALVASPALAANFIFGGTTAGDPTFNRPTSLSSLSGVGTAVPYELVPFFVTASGTYSMELHSLTTGYDPYALAYSSFSSGTPLAGLLNGDDDFSGSLPMLGTTVSDALTASLIASGQASNYAAGGLSLTAYTQYYAVVTGFANDDFGTFEAAVGGGPGDAIGGLVPEPSSIVLGALGLAAAIGYTVRRRSA